MRTKKIERIERTLQLGYVVKTNFSKLAKVPLSQYKRTQLEKELETTVKKAGRYLHISREYPHYKGTTFVRQ
jgi:hypothetical protein